MATEARDVRVGVVGLGLIAHLVYLPLLARTGQRLRVTAVCDAIADRAEVVGDRLGVRRFTSLQPLLESGEVDAVLLLTSGSHGPEAVAAQDAGLPILCEKPLAYTLAETAELRATPPLQLGYMKLFDPAVEEGLRQLPELGALRSVEVLVLHPSAERQLGHRRLPASAPADPAARRRSRQLAEAALGTEAADRFGPLYTGVALGSLVHELALVRAFAGAMTDIVHADVWPEDAQPPSVSVLGLSGSGVPVSLRWHYLAEQPAYFEELRVHGERGSLTLQFPTPYVLHAPTELTLSVAHGKGVEERRFTAFGEAFERQLEAFHAVCTGAGEPRAGVAEGRADIMTCQQIVRSVAERRGVAVAGEANR